MPAEGSPRLVAITHASGLPCYPCEKTGQPFPAEEFFQADPKSVAEQQPKASGSRERRSGAGRDICEVLGGSPAPPAPHPAGVLSLLPGALREAT